MSPKVSDLLIKPKGKQEELFCKKYNINLIRLDNGITIVGIPCKIDSTAWAKIKWEFPTGAYGNQAGIVHFLEHFINKSIRQVAERNSLQVNAFTSQLELGEEVSGIANPHVQDYGIWPILGKIRKSLGSPLNTVEFLDKEIESERQVINSEIRTVEAEQDFQVGKNFRKIVYAPENPLYDVPTVPGEEKDLDNVTQDFLRKAEEKVFIPDRLLISFYSEGDLSISKKITEKLRNLFFSFPRSGVKRDKLDKKLLDKINPDFKPRSVYSYNTNLRNGIVTTEFVWVLKNKFPTPPYFALRLLAPIIGTDLFIYARKRGWSYFTRVEVVRPSDNIAFLVLRIDSKKGDKTNFSEGIKEIVTNVNKSTQEICDMERKKQKAVPISIAARLSWIVDGLKDHNAMIDVDKIKPLFMNVEPQHIKNLIERVLLVKPVTIITGDLD